MASENPPAYKPKDAISASLEGLSVCGAAGLLVAAVQNSLARQNVSAWGVFTRSGGTIAVFGEIHSSQVYVLSAESDHP